MRRPRAAACAWNAPAASTSMRSRSPIAALILPIVSEWPSVSGHGVGELELRAVLVLDEHHDLRAIVFFEQKGQRLRRDERCRRRRRDARHEAEEVPRRVRLS